ncbi:uncharacterized protein LOC118188511 [Stegodyphus dumicola]|uniref:uncharacterized protein LOC118188511 n=1 Tax=Stegodyphus dumicola TaxID=202533 RepID=UPI0015AFE972|nr:uncharacterized protein LOC118188511 [Stegodyphus dumicola]
MNLFSITGIIFLCINVSEQCALPYWWTEQYHFLPYYPQAGQPKTTYKYRETLYQADPNNYVHHREYSEYTWWEHDTSNSQEFGNGLPLDFHHVTNAVFSKDGKIGGMHPGGVKRILPQGGTKGGVPHGGTNGMVPRGDTNGIVPADGTNGMFPQDTNGIIPADETNGMTPEDSVNRKSDALPTPNPDRETNENEREVISKSGDIEGNDLETGGSKPSSRLVEANTNDGYFYNWFGRNAVNETQPCKVSESNLQSLRSMIEKMFSFPREHTESKEKAREDILRKFKEFGLQVWTQNFTTPPIKNPNGTEEYNEGVNLVGVIPGSQRGHLDDEIVLVGAHYDTVADSNGVDDNGSGLAVMLEVARAITDARCRLNNTLMFVAFDHEENGAMGSNYFVDHYLIPEELKRARAKFQGAFILDGIMNYNDVPNTQDLPLDYAESLPGLQYFVNNTGNRGNFLAMISRNEMDNHLSQKLMNAWQDLGDHQYKLFNLAVDMGNNIPDPSTIQRHLNFLRSDHATFWYHNSSSHFPESLNAVLLTDTGPFRGQMKECYHNKCDDLTVISPEKLQFAKKTADALTATLVELTSATGAGNIIQSSWILYALHAIVLYCGARSFQKMC